MSLRPLATLAALTLIACSPAASEATEPADESIAQSASAAPAAFAPADLVALITAQGAENALMDLMAQPEDPRWQTLLTSVAGGDVAWIEAVAPLVPVLDGEAAESLFSVLGDALVHQPSLVLRAVGPDGMESTCQPYPPEMTEAKIAALQTVPDTDANAALRDECIQTLYQEPT